MKSNITLKHHKKLFGTGPAFICLAGLIFVTLLMCGCADNTGENMSKSSYKGLEEIANEEANESSCDDLGGEANDEGNGESCENPELTDVNNENIPVIFLEDDDNNARKEEAVASKEGVNAKTEAAVAEKDVSVAENGDVLEGSTQVISNDETSSIDEEAADKAGDESKDVGIPSDATASNDVTASNQVDWVDKLKLSANYSQIITIVASGSSAKVEMHQKNDDGKFDVILSGDASIGEKGIGKSKEGDRKTPRGVYGFLFAFGICDNPGCAISYTKVDATYCWVDDVNSTYYNKFVSTSQVARDWNSAENILGAGRSYNYALALDYNSACVKGAGSAIFMHCRPTGGAGCIAVDEGFMKKVLVNIKPGCAIVIDTPDGILTY